MSITQSKVTAQGQISVPAVIRKKLGIGPGSILEWDEHGDQVLIRKAGRHTCEEIHQDLFGRSLPKPMTSKPDIKSGIRQYIRSKHARD